MFSVGNEIASRTHFTGIGENELSIRRLVDNARDRKGGKSHTFDPHMKDED